MGRSFFRWDNSIFFSRFFFIIFFFSLLEMSVFIRCAFLSFKKTIFTNRNEWKMKPSQLKGLKNPFSIQPNLTLIVWVKMNFRAPSVGKKNTLNQKVLVKVQECCKFAVKNVVGNTVWGKLQCARWLLNEIRRLKIIFFNQFYKQRKTTKIQYKNSDNTSNNK